MINEEFMTLVLIATPVWVLVLVIPRVWTVVSLLSETNAGLARSAKDIVRALERIEIQRATPPEDILIPDPYKELEEGVWNHIYYTDKVATHMIYPLLFFWKPLYEIHGLPFQDRVNTYSVWALEELTNTIEQSFNVDVLPLRTELLKRKALIASS